MLLPPRTPAAVVQRLNREVVAALAKLQVRELLLRRGAEVVASSPAELTAMIKAEIGRIDKLIKDAGLPTER